MTDYKIFRGIVYKTTNLINGKFYIGKDSANRKTYLGSGKLLKQAFTKYGRINFTKEILEYCIDSEHMSIREIFWINELNAQNTDIGYNIADGGLGGDTFTNHPNKEAIRTKHKNRKRVVGYKFSLETKLKMSISRKGKPQSAEHKLHVIQAKTGKKWKMSAKGIENIRRSHLGITASLETKLKMSISRKGIKHTKRKTDSNNINNALSRLRVIVNNNTFKNIYLAINTLSIDSKELLTMLIDDSNTTHYFIKRGSTLKLLQENTVLFEQTLKFIDKKICA